MGVIAYRLSLVLFPLLVACTLPVFARTWLLHQYHAVDAGIALRESAIYLGDLLQTANTFAIIVYLIGNIASFGVLIATCLIGSLRWNMKRIYCIMAIGLLGITTVWAMTSPFIAHWTAIYNTIPPGTPVVDARGSLVREVLIYDLRALAIIPFGALVAMHPIFNPGARYWRALGMCPRCQYNLNHDLESGCPECGWNRSHAESRA